MKKHQHGLTLIELLLALAVFAILAVLAYGGLNTVLNTRESVKQESTHLATLQRGFIRLSRDFMQASPRLVRDAFGDVQASMTTETNVYAYQRKNAITGETINDKLEVMLEFSVAGKRLLPGQQRSRLQRIGYALQDNRLLRLNWLVLDRAQDSQPYVSEVLGDVTDLRFRFLDEQGEWLDSWPQDQTPIEKLPLAIEVNINDKEWGALRRVFLIS